jgi:hypothetical protein
MGEDLGQVGKAVKEEIAFNVTDENGALVTSLKILGGAALLFAAPVSALALVQGYENRPRSLPKENADTLKVILWTRGTIGVLVPLVTAALFNDSPDILKPVALSAIPLGLTILDALATGFVVKGINS